MIAPRTVLLCALLLLGPVAGSCFQGSTVGSLPPPQALAQARVALAQRRWEDADTLLRACLAANRSSSEAAYLFAFTLFREGLAKESLAEYTHAATLRTPTAFDLQTVALDYVLLNDFADADTWITRSLQMDPGDGETWYALGRIRYTENRFSDAVASFRHAMTLLPRSVKAVNNLGLALEGLNRPDEAIRAYRQAIAWQTPEQTSSEPFLNLGTLLSDRGDFDQSLELLQRAAALAPRDPRVHTALGKLDRRRNDLPDAQAEFKLALAARPDDAALHFQLGQVLRKEGLAPEAAAELARAAELNGTHSSPQR